MARFSDQFLDELRSRLTVSQVVGRKVALKKAGREYRGLSPFKTEKTPSFYVNDQKGFYHCFASSEHGDIFKFLMLTEGLTFVEAVTSLAQEAGMEVPAARPQTEEEKFVADRFTRMRSAMADAAAFFAENLKLPRASSARDILAKRGITPALISRFQIGFAFEDRAGLKAHLSIRKHDLDDIGGAGLLVTGDDIKVPFDRFRNRIMIPIRDPKGNVIAFGGRAVEAGVPAKYLNSPETDLFHKGRTLFNFDAARGAMVDVSNAIVVEGYMDAIAMVGAEFHETVAALGTAVTEDQLQMLWRTVRAPTLLLDGDRAGREASKRIAVLALPHVSSERTLMFADMPDGLDPDDLARQGGRDAVLPILEGARPLIDVLWSAETVGRSFSAPEDRARLERAVLGLSESIRDGVTRKHYQREFEQRLGKLFPSASRGSGRSSGMSGARDNARSPAQGGKSAHAATSTTTNYLGLDPTRKYPPREKAPAIINTGLVASLSLDANKIGHREAMIVCGLIVQIDFLAQIVEGVARLPIRSAPLSGLVSGIIEAATHRNFHGSVGELVQDLETAGFATILPIVMAHQGSTGWTTPGSPDRITFWQEIVSEQDKIVGMPKDVADARRDWTEAGSDDALKRLEAVRAEMVSRPASQG